MLVTVVVEGNRATEENLQFVNDVDHVTFLIIEPTQYFWTVVFGMKYTIIKMCGLQGPLLQHSSASVVA